MATQSHDSSTLDRRSQDKILQSMGRGNEVTVTNDGATILKSIYIDNPAAKVLVGELNEEISLLSVIHRDDGFSHISQLDSYGMLSAYRTRHAV